MSWPDQAYCLGFSTYAFIPSVSQNNSDTSFSSLLRVYFSHPAVVTKTTSAMSDRNKDLGLSLFASGSKDQIASI